MTFALKCYGSKQHEMTSRSAQHSILQHATHVKPWASTSHSSVQFTIAQTAFMTGERFYQERKERKLGLSCIEAFQHKSNVTKRAT